MAVEAHIERHVRELQLFDKRLNFFPRLTESAQRFRSLLERPDLSEREVHLFLQSRPELLDATAESSHSEVALGADYRVDIVLQHKLGSVERTTLIELENPNHLLFTKTGRPRATVTHAIQQVEDWIRWWRRHPDKLPTGINSEYPPHGLVVMGRSRDLGEEEASKVEHLNANRTVRLLTYDHLLERYERMLHSILNVQESHTPD